jgi:Ferric reductase like transmembrane component
MTASAPSALWYATRGSGYAALILLTASVVLGVLTAVRWHSAHWPRFLVQAVHRSVSLLVLVFLALHIVTAVLDPFAHLGARDALLPFSSSYRPVWLGLGVVGMELLLALVVTSLVRHRLGFRAWRAVHWLAYAAWPLALVHGLGTGTDTASEWGLVLDLGCAGAVLVAVAWRLSEGWPRRAPVRLLAGLAAAAGVVAVAAWTANGPLQPGWARAAGTPAGLLAGSAAATSAPGTSSPAGTPSSPATAAPVGGLAPGIDDRVRGAAPQDDGTTTRLQLTDVGDPSLSLAIAIPDGAAGGQASLRISRGGTLVCTAPATVAEGVQARCGSTQVSIGLEERREGSLVGELVTQAAGS